jgi:hypothetical protein
MTLKKSRRHWGLKIDTKLHGLSIDKHNKPL